MLSAHRNAIEYNIKEPRMHTCAVHIRMRIVSRIFILRIELHGEWKIREKSQLW